ncbi:MAG: hypothetical protein IPK26_13590 [Planctomycetes bacterium]|nr:hypothetical protein [Planctomycetota bacterium]
MACWRRFESDDAAEPEGPLPEVDLEVFSLATGGGRLAVSGSPANAYERAVFQVAVGVPELASGFRITVTRQTPNFAPQSVVVTIAARRLPDDLDPSAEDSVHAGSGDVASVPAGVACQTATPTSRNLDVVAMMPQGYVDAWGSGPFARSPAPGFPPATAPGLPPTYVGCNLAQVIVDNPGFGPLPLLHFQVAPPDIPGPVVIGGLAFRTWRPFDIDGTLVVEEVFMENSATQFVTPGSLGSLPNPNATNLVVGGSVVLADPGPDWVEPRFDRYAVVLPFTTSFAHNPNTINGNLDIWIRFSRTSTAQQFQVDCTADEDPTYGTSYQASIPVNRQVATVGSIPIIGLLAGATPLIQSTAVLVAHGEPRIGQGLELQVGRLPANALVAMAFGGFGHGVPFGPCQTFVTNAITTPFLVADAAGFVRLSASPFPVNGASLHSELGIQAVFLAGPTVLFSNALRVRVGGSL